jgi:3-keto-L-gulonate-6-phosphate decarboxylase
VSARVVFEACKDFIAWHEDEVKKIREDMITAEMTTGWKWLRPKTREAAIKRLESHRLLDSEYHKAGMTYGAQLRRVKDLLALAKVAVAGNGVMELDERAARDISSFVKT